MAKFDVGVCKCVVTEVQFDIICANQVKLGGGM